MNDAENPYGIRCVDCDKANPCAACREQIAAENEYAATVPA